LVYREAVQRNISANSVDDIPNCDFFFGSVVSRGDLQVAISTSGQSPALAQRLRSEIDQQLPADLAPWLTQLGQLRREILSTHPAGEERRLLLHELAQRPVCPSPDCPARQLAYQPIHTSEPGDDNQVYGEIPDLSAPYEEEPDPFAAFAELGESGEAPTVHLVGAGPGDPDLLTVKALRLIQTADVILHDDLIPTAILDLASPSALVQNVGKRCGIKTITQAEINALLVSHARAGRSVVRLKSGDPLLFGRAAEELDALAAASVPAEIVPGITAAFAAAAAIGCSLTARGSASSLRISTGHHAPQSPQPQSPPSKESPRPTETRVVYMPGRDLHPLAQALLAEGLPADLPCVLISHASQPGQQFHITTLGLLGTLNALPAPSVLIAGWAVRKPSTDRA
jgi:uroporphyrin-III C-methyltransferase